MIIIRREIKSTVFNAQIVDSVSKHRQDVEVVQVKLAAKSG